MASRRPIIHPTDFSPASRPALAKAIQLAKAGRAPLLILHVLPPLPMLPDAYIAVTTFNELQRGHCAHGQHQLGRVVASAKAAGARATGLLLDFGITAEQIVRVAKSKRAEVIVMGTHGRSGIKRAILGSVAERVVATAPCPVMTVRAR